MSKEYDPAALDREILDALPVSFGLTATEVAQKVRPGASNSKWAHDANRRNMNRVRARLAALVRSGKVLKSMGRYFNREPARVEKARAREEARDARREKVRQALDAAGFQISRDGVGFGDVTLSHDQFLELARKAGLVD